MMHAIFAAALLLGAMASAGAQTSLRVGDQKGNSRAVMEAAGVLRDVPYKIEWKEFPAAAPLLEALGAGAIETGLVGDAPFTFAAAANVPVKAIGAIRQSRQGLAILVPRESHIQAFEDLQGRRSQPAAARSAISSFLRRLNQGMVCERCADRVSWTMGRKGRIYPGVGRCLVDLGALCEPGGSAVPVAARDHGRRHRAGTQLSGRLAGCDPRQAAGTGGFPSAAHVRQSLVDDPCRCLRAELGQADEYPSAVPLNWLSRAEIRLAPIDDGVVADEQKTIDLYFRPGLIKNKLNAANMVDRSFATAIEKGAGL